MNNLTTFNTEFLENNQKAYLYFKLGENKYAVKIEQVVEIIKLPLLDYPQKLANNSIGLLKYNSFTINVLDLRFYLNIEVTPYNTSNKILIVKTDETIFGLIIDKAFDIFSYDFSKSDSILSNETSKIIEAIYQKNDETISIIDLNMLEAVLKEGVVETEIYIPSLFPKDDDAIYEFRQRNLILQQKTSNALTLDMFSQDQFILFSLGKNLYCINFKYVKEFIKNIHITKVPCSLDYILGLIAVKGDFITVVDLNMFLTGIQTEKNSKNNIIIINNNDYSIGFLVDEIKGIINIPEELIKKDLENSNRNILSEVILDKNFYTILDIENILSDERLFINDTI